MVCFCEDFVVYDMVNLDYLKLCVEVVIWGKVLYLSYCYVMYFIKGVIFRSFYCISEIFGVWV